MNTFKIATWNVNSIRVRLPHLLDWMKVANPDVIALQETKSLDEHFPWNDINAAGYQVIFTGEKSYNGVAILSRNAGNDLVTSIPGLEDTQRRFLALTVDDVRVVNVYVPNGQDLASPKFEYKLHWLQMLTQFIREERKRYSKMVILGDFNIAPHERDVHDPKAWEGQILCSPQERAAFNELLGLGFHDIYRHINPDEQAFSWWDYRLNAFKRNLGLRIDHILVSEEFSADCAQCSIDKTPRAWERPSDHAPVVAEWRFNY